LLSRAALIVAAGSGSRFGHETPKQYHKLQNQKSILEETISIFDTHPMIDLVAVVVAKEHPYRLNFPHTYGGKTRQESVRNGLRFLKKYNPKHILIHDGVRPFVSKDLISEVLYKLETYQAVDIGQPIIDTIKTYDGSVIPRETLYASQTPQGFHFDMILDLYEKATDHYTDDISLYLAAGGTNLAIAVGDPKNIKITFKEDLKQQ
jgi:2-C-methyl-D-erythritol 4-phosphate cytidylyltransferase/2-C-methyl-D-erythritol 2,4-cyclodiphosphate synthase